MNSDPRHRAQYRQLWIDKVRDQLGNPAAGFERSVRIEALGRLTHTNREFIKSLPPDELEVELLNHDLAGSLSDIAVRALKARGYPQRELTIGGDYPACEAQVCAALNWCGFNILCGPDTHVMILDDRTAKAVADSNNSAITAAELMHLPHNPCLIEFYRPIEVAEKVRRGVRVRAVGFEAAGSPDVPVAVVYFYLDYWQSIGGSGTRSPVMAGIWFGGFYVINIDEGARTQIGIEAGSKVEAEIMEVCKRVARNLWDFVTSRSIRYEQVQRKPSRQLPVPPNGSPPMPSKLDREVSFLFLSHDAKLPKEAEGPPRPTTPWDHRVEVPGTFHELVYCAKCGDLHRHDLLGQACRKCAEIVGPRANLRVEKYWHSPYVKGPEGTPLKDVVRVVRRRKKGSQNEK